LTGKCVAGFAAETGGALGEEGARPEQGQPASSTGHPIRRLAAGIETGLGRGKGLRFESN